MVLATHCIRQFPLHFPSSALPCAITFQPDSTIGPSDTATKKQVRKYYITQYLCSVRCFLFLLKAHSLTCSKMTMYQCGQLDLVVKVKVE